MEKLKRINEKEREKADVRYEAAHLREYKEYRKVCARIANRHYGLDRPEGMQIDHKYSIHDGWLNGIPAPILSHPFNLRLITAEENNSKGLESIISLEELYKGTGQKWDGSIQEIKALTRECKYCGKEFPYNLKHKYKQFCNDTCSANWAYHNNVKIVTKECEICGTPFETRAYRGSRTCKPECGHKLSVKNRLENKKSNQ